MIDKGMGNFNWAISQMKQGKTLRKRCWVDKTLAIYIDDLNFFQWDHNRTKLNEFEDEPHMTLEWIEATDWEIYKDVKKRLYLCTDCNQFHYDRDYYSEDGDIEIKDLSNFLAVAKLVQLDTEQRIEPFFLDIKGNNGTRND